MMLGRLRKLSNDPDGVQVVSIALNADFREAYDEFVGQDISVDIKPWKKGRSLEANAFAWLLIGKISEKMQAIEPDGYWTPERVYLDAISGIGGIYAIAEMPLDAVEVFRQIWTYRHIGRRVEIMDEDGSTANVRISYGSSDFDTAQMSTLINILIQQAEALGIPTLSDQEIERMLGNWKKTEERRKENGKTDQKAG
jgi:hypothetical protein